ncbi:Cdc37 N terminal kinase binding-domain-containing protein, partial [Lactarius deliciosus]
IPLNYSKWDQLEVSDSDIKGHPNIDKISLIRWKLRDVHEKREARNHRIEQLGAEVAGNDALLARLRVLQPKLAQSGSSYFSSEVDRLRTNPSLGAPPANIANWSRTTRSYLLLSSKTSQKRYKMLRPYVVPFPPYHRHLF